MSDSVECDDCGTEACQLIRRHGKQRCRDCHEPISRPRGPSADQIERNREWYGFIEDYSRERVIRNDRGVSDE